MYKYFTKLLHPIFCWKKIEHIEDNIYVYKCLICGKAMSPAFIPKEKLSKIPSFEWVDKSETDLRKLRK